MLEATADALLSDGNRRRADQIRNDRKRDRSNRRRCVSARETRSRTIGISSEQEAHGRSINGSDRFVGYYRVGACAITIIARQTAAGFDRRKAGASLQQTC